MHCFSLYLILDELFLDKFLSSSVLLAILQQRISCVQLRMKTASLKEIQETAKKLSLLLKPANIPLIINDHIALAKKIHADGVHIGQNDMPYLKARRYLGAHKIIGLSIENETQALLCRHFSADYFGIGPVFNTSTKSDAAPSLGIEGLKKITAVFPQSVPLIAIGGIDPNNTGDILKTGVSGIAVCSAILDSPFPAKSAQQFFQLLSK